ncbi:AAA family ATPase [Neolewinella sp.]|uniref:AAA family ATPase n=1 Tax=Neolewinella sp. TaxID=2993543 RepID=UPI003B525412
MTIRITGPESSGKTTLAQALAWSLDGWLVAEQARPYLAELGRPYQEHDLPLIWEAQQRAEYTARSSGASFIICDTGPEVIRIWSKVKYGRCAASVLSACKVVPYDLTLLCAPDLPWTYDPMREHPEGGARWGLFARYRELLPNAGVVRAEYRIEQAVTYVNEWLEIQRSSGLRPEHV